MVRLMNGWQFAASVIGSLAWPAAVVGLAVLFRVAIRRLLSGDVKRWKAGPSGLEIEFAEPLQDHVAGTRQILEVATADLGQRIAKLEDQLTAPNANTDALKDELRMLRGKLRATNQALASLEDTLDHMAKLPPGVRGTVTFAGVAGRRPTVTFEVVRPDATGDAPKA